MPDISGEDENENENDDDEEQDEEQGSQSCIPLVVRVSKQNGPSLEFTCTAYADEIAIDSLSIKDPDTSEDQVAYEGPDFGWVLLQLNIYILDGMGFFWVVLLLHCGFFQGFGRESAEIFPQVSWNQRNQAEHDKFLARVHD